MGGFRVRQVRTFPARGEPGVSHDEAFVAEVGLTGDRPRKAAVSLVGTDSPHTRANLVLDAPTEQVERLRGAVVRIGGVVLALEATGTACPGLYGAVGVTGTLRVGDRVDVVADGVPLDAAAHPTSDTPSPDRAREGGRAVREDGR